MKRPLIVEFVGLPGAGKTTIVDRVIEMERRENLGVLSFRSLLHVEHDGSRKSKTTAGILRAVGTVGLFLKKRGMMLHLLRYALLSKPFCRSRIGFVRGFIRLAWCLDSRRADVPREHKVELLEQGFVQILGSIALPGTPTSSKCLEALVPCALADWVDGLVWVECSPETAMIRVRNRAHRGSRFDSWPDEIFRQNQMVMLKVLRDATRLAGLAGVPVLTVSSADPPCKNAVRVRAWLQHVLSSSPRQHNTADSARGRHA